MSFQGRRIAEEKKEDGTRLPAVRLWIRDQLRDQIHQRGIEEAFQKIAMPHQVVWDFSRLLLEEPDFESGRELANKCLHGMEEHQSALWKERDILREELSSSGISVLFLKGSAYEMAGIAYPGRQCADVDLLFLAEEDYRRALVMFGKRGFRPSSTVRLRPSESGLCSTVELKKGGASPHLSLGCYLACLPDYPPDLLRANVEILSGKLPFQSGRASEPWLSPEAMVVNFLWELRSNCAWRIRDALDWAMLADSYERQWDQASLRSFLNEEALMPMVEALDHIMPRPSGLVGENASNSSYLGERLSRTFMKVGPRKRVLHGMPLMEALSWQRLAKEKGRFAAAKAFIRNVFRVALWRGLKFSGSQLRSTRVRRRFLQGSQAETADQSLDRFLQNDPGSAGFG